MKIINTLQEMQSVSYPQGQSVGFVPTMGYLHEGHLSLVARSNQECDLTVVSIYVNPAQFGPNEDLSSYPRNLQRDLDLLGLFQVDYVFIPDDAMMYPKGYLTWVEVEQISNILCGASRPGHFKGVATIVLKLINLVRPTRMYMGEKDYQQVKLLTKMAADLNLSLKIVPCPIVRESDGLALSSRNVYLSPEQRIQARSLSQAWMQAQNSVQTGITSTAILISDATQLLLNAGARPDYVKIIHSDTLEDQSLVTCESRMLIAAYIGNTRLIDNCPLNP
ncbi:MAG TPA: pantoate--beta-alanine ligase [Candidatus Cloacimonadota bacterium]|nr:pantoate--beta-alanine ligase [Candidatus Cloacimonadota bacterium]